MKGSVRIFEENLPFFIPWHQKWKKVFSSFYVYLLVLQNKYSETKRKIEKNIELKIHRKDQQKK